MKKYRLPLACALVVLLSLALPFAVFFAVGQSTSLRPAQPDGRRGPVRRSPRQFHCLHAVRLQPCTERPAGLQQRQRKPLGADRHR